MDNRADSCCEEHQFALFQLLPPGLHRCGKLIEPGNNTFIAGINTFIAGINTFIACMHFFKAISYYMHSSYETASNACTIC